MFNGLTDSLSAQLPSEAPTDWFDRFYFNAHDRPDGPYLLVGAGVYPFAQVVDGYAIYVDGNEQLNLRLTASYEGKVPSGVGPLRWEVLEPMNAWRVVLDENASGLRFDLTWTARTPMWNCSTISFDTGRDTVIDFDHGFQSGYHSGFISYRGESTQFDKWHGQRDRSMGRRAAGGGQGLHLWVQGQFATEAVSFMLDLDRSGKILILDGAVLGAGGQVDEILDVKHCLNFDDRLNLTDGDFSLTTRSGRSLLLKVDSSTSRGGYLAGGGYGGEHGRTGGGATVRFETWDLNDERHSPRHLDTPLTDRLSAFVLTEGETREIGAGIAEFSHTRSPNYVYSPTYVGAQV